MEGSERAYRLLFPLPGAIGSPLRCGLIPAQEDPPPTPAAVAAFAVVAAAAANSGGRALVRKEVVTVTERRAPRRGELGRRRAFHAAVSVRPVHRHKRSTRRLPPRSSLR